MDSSLCIIMQQWASFAIASDSVKLLLLPLKWLLNWRVSLIFSSVHHSLNMAHVKAFVSVRSLLWILLPMLVQLLPWLMCIFPWQSQQMTPWLQTTLLKVVLHCLEGIAITTQNTTARVPHDFPGLHIAIWDFWLPQLWQPFPAVTIAPGITNVLPSEDVVARVLCLTVPARKSAHFCQYRN